MGKYDELVIHPPKMRMTVNEDGRQVFNGFMANEKLHGCKFTMGFQIVTKPFIGDNPAHRHNFQEFLAWYGTNPDDPFDFDAEIELFMGEEQERYLITQPTLVSLPAGLIHSPLNILRVGKPIVQLEVMLPPLDGSDMVREFVMPEDRGIDPYSRVTLTYTPQPE